MAGVDLVCVHTPCPGHTPAPRQQHQRQQSPGPRSAGIGAQGSGLDSIRARLVQLPPGSPTRPTLPTSGSALKLSLEGTGPMTCARGMWRGKWSQQTCQLSSLGAENCVCNHLPARPRVPASPLLFESCGVLDPGATRLSKKAAGSAMWESGGGNCYFVSNAIRSRATSEPVPPASTH